MQAVHGRVEGIMKEEQGVYALLRSERRLAQAPEGAWPFQNAHPSLGAGEEGVGTGEAGERQREERGGERRREEEIVGVLEG